MCQLQPVRLTRKDLLDAAVAVLITCEPEPALLLTVRSRHLPRHSGEIAFPGGLPERSDKTLLDTAIRELQEETALPASRVEIIGELDDVLTLTGYKITPFVGLLHTPFHAVPDGGEIDEIFFVPLAHFLRIPIVKHRTIFFRRTARTFRYYQFRDRIIWGATARITEKLVAQLHLAGLDQRR